MTDYRVVPAEPAHVVAVAANLRPADADEILATSGGDPAKAVASSVACSTHAWAGLADGRAVCLFGVGPESLLGGRGIVWMLGTPAIEKHSKAFLRRSRPVVAAMRATYPVLTNHVDCRNVKSINWLKWLGFRMDEPEPYGIAGLPFMRFSMGE